MENMFWVGLVMVVLGFIIFVAVSSDNKPGGAIGYLMAVAGVVFAAIGINAHDNAQAEDLMSRTFRPTKAVIETHQTQTKESGGECIQSFKLDSVPYTFEKPCSSFFVEASFSPPRVGDFMRVMYIAPETAEGKPKVLEVYNLTQEIERVLGAPLCRPKNPAQTPEAPLTSPEAPARSRSRTLPAPRAE